MDKKILMAVAVAAGVVFVGGCEKKANLDSDESKYSYAAGYRVGNSIKQQDSEFKLDVVAFSQAVKDVMDGKEPALTDEQMNQAVMKMFDRRREKDRAMAESNKKIAEEFLAKNKTKDGVIVTKTGLQYEVLSKGKGPKPKEDDIVEVDYKGTFPDGKEFDSSFKRGKPAQFPVKAVIPGWTEALMLMNVGSKFRLVIPPELGYGERGNPSIPGNSVLIFEVELKSIKKESNS